MKMEYKNLLYGNGISSYLKDSVLKPRDFYSTGLEDSLENIVLKEDPVQERTVMDKVFADKNRTLKATIKALFNEILSREKLSGGLLSKIDSDICKTDSYLEQIKMITRRQYLPDLEIAFSRRKTQLESQVIDLEKEKRQEYVACWRDLISLKKYLLSALKDYWNGSNKSTFLKIENDEYKHRGSMQETEAYNW